MPIETILAGAIPLAGALVGYGVLQQRVSGLAREVQTLRTRDGEILAALGDLRVGQAELRVKIESIESRIERLEAAHGIVPSGPGQAR